MKQDKDSTVARQQLEEILRLHALWVRDEVGGSRADLYGANLSQADLYGANLSHADLSRADLSHANLSHANLSRANLLGADLSHANLLGADLSHANLYGADLSHADLLGANLYGADLSNADLLGANLSHANLSHADLLHANLSQANLSHADLLGADLSHANLYGVRGSDLAIARMCILPDGDLICWKKCRDGVIAKLRIPSDAKRLNAFGRKCRAERAEVLEIIGADKGVSLHDKNFVYRAGETVSVDNFDEDFRNECSSGIHFYITRKEAEAHQ